MSFIVPLFAVLFEAPLTAAAVAGGTVSIPIIIHLLNRRRFRIVPWAAMRFLLAAQKKNARRMRLEQLLLLIVRCLVVLLLVVAMASVTGWAEKMWRWMNPEGGKGIAAGGARTHKILVLDGSFSMGLKQGDTNSFEKARALALELVEAGAGTDGFSVVLMAAPPRRIVPEPSEDGKKVAAELRAMKATHGNADLPATLNTVASLLRSSPGKFPTKEVYFFTDLQRSNWISPRPGDLSNALQTIGEMRAKSIFVDVGQDGANNLAVTGLELGEPVATTGTETRLQATLFNYGDKREVSVRLFVGKAKEKSGEKPVELRQVAETTVNAGRNQQTPVSFTYKFPAQGDYVVQVQAAHDSLELDDQRSLIVRVRNTVPVLLVNGKSAKELFDRASQWVRMALNPFEEGERVPVHITARPTVISSLQFGDKGDDLSAYDAVILCDVPSVTSTDARRLEAHVRRGGAVIVCLGGEVKDLGGYNDKLFRGGKGILPARLVGVQQATPGYSYQFSLTGDAERKDPLKPFLDPAARERLMQPRFWKFVQTVPTRAVRGIVPRKVLGFTPVARPGVKDRSTPPPSGTAIWEWQPPLPGDKERRDGPARRISGRGRVVLITTTVNSDWNNWPASPAFPPLIQEVFNDAIAPRLRGQALAAGEVIELYLTSSTTGVEAKVEMPRDPMETPDRVTRAEDRVKTTTTKASDDGSVLRFGETDISGIYKVRLGKSPREYLYAVNVPASTDDQQASESNLTRTSSEELQKTYPEWDTQVVGDLAKVEHATATGEAGDVTYYAPQGTAIARVLLLIVLGLVLLEVVLAWQFGHYSAAPATPLEARPNPGWKEWSLWSSPWVMFALLGCVAFVLIHDAVTGDFMSFLPDSVRGWIERLMDIPPPEAGEGSRWRLEYEKVFKGGRADLWILGTLAGVAVLGVTMVYRREGHALSGRFRALLVGLRMALLALLLAVFLPQVRLYFERQGWPDVVIIIDDSYSMSTHDVYRDEAIRKAADALAEKGELSEEEKTALAKALAARPEVTKASRLRLARNLLLNEDRNWLQTLLSKRKVRLHVYRCATRAERLADATTGDDVGPAIKKVAGLKADPGNDTSQLGTAVRQVINDFRGSSLAAVIMLTDGVTTEGEDLASAAKYAQQRDVPLFFVGIGDSHEQRDVYLHDLQVDDQVFVNDTVVFEVRLTALGYKALSLPVALYEKGKKGKLFEKTVQVDANNRSVKVQLKHRPTRPGERTFVIRVPVQEGEIDKENNRIERTIYVREAKQIKVLYVEGYRRYEYHYLKTLLERESNRIKGNKSVKLRVLLLDADKEFPEQDATAISAFPVPDRDLDVHTKDTDLWSYDVVILGDVDPEPRNNPAFKQHLKNVAELVRERGGGLLMLAGERFAPKAYKNSPLKDILPIDLTAERAEPGDGGEDILETFRAELTSVGRVHPIFRFLPDEKDNDEIWGRLKEMYWHADGYVPKRAAEVLATHPKLVRLGKKSGNQKHPLVMQHFAGAGRCLFLGVNETWRWNWREDQQYYNQFWIQMVRYLARSKVGKIEMRLQPETRSRRGQPVKITVRFPDDERPPAEKTEVKVSVERTIPGRVGDVETRTIKLSKLPGSRATYEAILTRTPEGNYRFRLVSPEAKPQPQAELKILAPPGELEQLRMNQSEMEQAALATEGKFYTLDSADSLLDELPSGNRVTVNAPGPPWVVWNHPLLFLLGLGIIVTEWLLRKQKNLL